jgi:protein O-mannosyl-transferase
MDRMSRETKTLRMAGAAAIVLLTALAYVPAMSGKFVWDDNSWTTGVQPLLQDGAGLWRMWIRPISLQQYYPLAGTTFWIDYHLWGFNPIPYHIENLSLHIVSALLFWELLRRLKVPGAWLAAAIFAVHPVMVESVAWITERKNVLSMVLFLSSLLAYGRFSGYWNESETKQNWWAWGLALVLFCAALLAKATAFSLPAVLLLICWWKRGTIRFKRDVLPTLPFFFISVGFCLGTSWLEKNHVGAKGPDWQISFPARCLIAGRAIWFYFGKLLWPSQLCFIYPRWHLNTGSWRQWMFPISVLAILLTLWQLRHRIGRGPLTACLFFIGTLFPALGFMNAYFMKFSFVCDHWTYLSSLGIFALVGGLVAVGAKHWRLGAAERGFCAVVLCVLAILTWRQCGMYADVDTLWRETIARNPDAWMARFNLGSRLQAAGQFAEAKEQYERTLQIRPDCLEAQNNLAWLLATVPPADGGDPVRAVALAESACELSDHRDANSLDTLAVAYASDGRFSDAITTGQEAITVARATQPPELIERMEARLQLYRDGRPYLPDEAVSTRSP